jgi:hypothetical protein
LVHGGLTIRSFCSFAEPVALIDAPQLVQKRTHCEFFSPHLGQTASAIDAPQLLQNFPLPAGLPQEEQTTVLLSIFPFQTVAASAASSMFRRIASARAFATATSCLGAQSVQSISSSL